MSYLEAVTADERRQILAEIDGKRATQRVIVGINDWEGISQTPLAAWYDVSPTTIVNWLKRLERLATEPFDDVVYDSPRSGPPPKLTDEQREQLEQALQTSPKELAIDARRWEPAIVQRYITEIFTVEYGICQVCNLVYVAGVSLETVRQKNQTADERAREAF